MNFTSDVHQFTPYIPENPVDAMVIVGMQKQQELQQGIQKVQGYVDYLHGFDLAKGATREYVQGKINDLRDSVSNLAGNFSESRLTNQIGGLAGKIAGDPIVQNGILSTAAYRKGVQDIEDSKKLNKDGKGGNYAVQNEWDFMTKAFYWLNDGDYTTSFSDTYTPHTDYMKMFTDAYKEIHPSSSLSQNQIRINDGTGQIEVLNQRESEGIDANEVNRLWSTISSDPAVQKQISIDARYRYKDLGPQDLYQHLSDDYSRNIDGINQKINEIQERAIYDKTIKPEETAAAIKALKDQGSQFDAQYKNIASMIPGVQGGDFKNLDAAKTAIFSTDLASSLASTYSWSKSSDKIVDSPLWKAHMDQINYELQMAKFGEEVRHNQATEANTEMRNLLSGIKSTGKGKTSGGTEFETYEDQVDKAAGELGSSTYYEKTKDLTTKVHQGIMEAIFNMAAKAPGDNVNPVKLTANGYEYNDKYPGGPEEARRAGGRIWTGARQSMMQGKQQPYVIDEFSKVDPLIREVNNRRFKASEIEKTYEPELQKVAAQYGKPIDRKMLDYWIVDNNAPGKEAAQKRLDSLSNQEKDELEGVVHGTVRTPYGTSTYDTKEYRDLSSFLKKSTDLIPTLQKREDEFKGMQTAFNPTVTHLTLEDKEKPVWEGRFQRAAEKYNLNDNAKEFLNWAYAKDSKGEVPVKNQQYNITFDKNTNSWGLRISRGADYKELKVDERLIQDWGFDTRDEFWEKFGADLEQTNNTKAGNGIQDSYYLNQPSGSRYDVRYNLIGNGQGGYDMKLFIFDNIDPKAPKLVANGAALGGYWDGKTIMQLLHTGLKDEEIQAILKK